MDLISDITLIAGKYLIANPDEKIYLLIDHAGMPGLIRKVERGSERHTSLFNNSREHGALSVSPILILFGHSEKLQMREFLIRWICEQAIYTSTLMMLGSRLDIDDLTTELTLRLEARISDDMDAVLRFFDPRIFECLAKVLRAEQLANLCNPARTWWYVDRQGHFIKLEQEFRYVKNNYEPLELTEGQEFSLIEASEPDQVIHILDKVMPKVRSSMPKDIYGFVVDNMRSASKSGLIGPIDFALYSIMVATRGINFETLPYWRQAMDNVRAGSISFADAVAESADLIVGD